MAINTLFLTGFEHGFVSTGASAGGGLFDTITGPTNWSASTSSPRNGAYCAHLVAPASTFTSITKSFTGDPIQLVQRFGVKVTSRPSSGTAILAGSSVASGLGFFLRVSSAGILTLEGAGGPGGAITGPTIDTTSWHLIEIQFAASSIAWKVDGVTQTPVASGTAGFFSTRLGTTVNTDQAFTADFDDWIIGTWTVAGTDWYGDGKIIAQPAGVDGTHATITSLSPGDAGTAYSGTPTTVNTMVDDPAGTLGWTATRSTTDNIALRTATVGAYAAIGPATTSQTGSANEVRAVMSYSSSTTTANRAACDVRNSAGAVTELWGLTGGVGQAYNVSTNNFKAGIVTKPAAGWTAAEVNAIRFRFGGCTSVDINPVPTVQALMLEVDWPIIHPSSPPLDETSIDDFNRADGPIYSGAGAGVWETAGGLFNTSSVQATIAGNALAGSTSDGWANSKVQLDTSFDLIFDVSTAPTAGTINVAFGLTDLLTAGVDGWWFQTTSGPTWGLYYYTNGTKGSAVVTASGGHPVAGSSIWIEKRGTVITVYYRVSAAEQYAQVLTVTDARGNVASPFLFNVNVTTGRLDNVRGGPLVSTGAALAGTVTAVTALTGTFAIPIPAAGLVAADSTATATLTVTVTVPVAAAATAASAVTGSLTVRAPLAATAIGVSAATGTLTARASLAAAPAADSATTGVLTARAGLAATSAAVSTATGSLTGRATLTAAPAGVAATTGTLTARATLVVAPAAVSAATGSLTVTTFDPSALPDLAGWWKADALALTDGAAVTSWTDSSGGGHSLTGTGPTYQANEVNGLPAVEFDGVDDWFAATSMTADLKPVTIFALIKPTVLGLAPPQTIIGGAANGGLIYRIDDGEQQLAKQNVANIGGSTPNLLTADYQIAATSYSATGDYVFYRNGVTTGSGTNDQTLVAAALQVGARSSGAANWFTGLIAELIIYDRVLSGSERGQVEGYLIGKYLPPAGTIAGSSTVTAALTNTAPAPVTVAATSAATAAATGTLTVRAALAGTSYYSEVIADTPALYWRLGESAGTTAEDATANNRDGTLATHIGTPILGQASLLGGDANTALKLNEGIVTSTYAPFVNVTVRSFEFWVKHDGTGTTNSVVCCSSAANTFSIRVVPSTGDIYCNENGGMRWAAAAPTANRAYHILLTIDPDGNPLLYIDGVFRDYTTDYGVITYGGGNVQLGGSSGGFTAMSGLIDEFTVYEHGFSPVDVAEHYAARNNQPAAASAATGTLTGRAALQATSAGVAALTGTLTVIPAGANALTGTSAAVSALTGTLLLTKPLAGTAAAVSSAAAVLTVRASLSAAPAGVSTAIGVLTARPALTGTVAGVAAVSGTLLLTKPLAATSAAVSTATGALTVAPAGTNPLIAAVTAVSNVTGSLLVTKPLAATSAATSTVSGTLLVTKPLAVTVTGVSTATATLRSGTAFAAVIVGTSNVTGALTLTKPLAAAVTAASTVSGTIVIAAVGENPLIAHSTPSSAVTGTLNVTKPLAATVAAAANVTGTLTGRGQLAATSAAASSSSGVLYVSDGLAATVNAVSTVTAGTPLLSKALTGAITPANITTGVLTVSCGVAATTPGASSVTGTLTISHLLTGLITPASDLTGTIGVLRPLAGIVTAQSTVLGVLGNVGPVTAVGRIEDAVNAIYADSRYSIYMSEAGSDTTHPESTTAVLALIE